MSDFFSYLTSSTISAITTKTVVAPLERVKILKQVQSYYSHENYTNIFQSLKHIYKNEGFKGYFKGNLSNITRVIPNYAIKFPMNDIYRNILKKILKINNLNYFQLLSCGILSGLNSVILTFPLDLARTRMTLDKNMADYTSLFDCGKKIVKKEGILALYKGISISCVTSPLYIGLQLSLYDEFKNNWFDNKLLSGACAGIIAQSLMYPGDTIKRQLQINGLDGNKKKYNNLHGCIKHIYKIYGIRGFYPAVGTNMIKSIPETSVQFFIYDYCKELFSN